MPSFDKSAMEAIDTHERTALQPEDHAAFFEALDNPPAPAEALRAAVGQYRRRVVSC